MSYTGLNKDPLTKIQQFLGKNAFLIDCDGGLGTAFHPKGEPVMEPELIKSFPSNSDIFLFYNIDDDDIVERMKKLEPGNPNVRLVPNINKNSKNGADMNLSFILGTISEKYDRYVIVARSDQAYKEMVDRLEYEQPRLKNHVDLHRFESPKGLTQYVRKFDKVQNENQDKFSEGCMKSKSATPSSHMVKFTTENLFHPCPLESWEQSSRLYLFAELLDHLDHKHLNFCYQYCSKCEEMVQENKRSPDRSSQFEKHYKEAHLDNQAGFSLDIWPVK